MSVARNIVANLFGRGWTAVLNLLTVPFYVKFLGMDSYGLVGIYLTLLGLLAVLDLGLSTTLNRVMAQHVAGRLSRAEVRNLVRTFEALYWAIGVVIGAVVFAAAPVIATKWIHHGALSDATVKNALRLMSVVIFFQWPTSLYAGGLQGLQCQVTLNLIRTASATIQAGGAILVLAFAYRTIEAFFAWQVLGVALQTCLLAVYLWKALPAQDGSTPRPEWRWLAHNWRFSAGTSGIALLSTVLMQVDKVILSKVLSLREFGFYTLAFAVSSALSNLATPVFSAVFPRLSQLHAADDERGVSRVYHRSSLLMSFLIFPVGLCVAFFARQVLTPWLRDASVVAHVAPLVSVIILGSIANLTMTLPFTLQLASGWTSLSFFKNIVAIALYVPGLFILIHRWEGMGAAIAWLALNSAYVVFEPIVMHRRLLRSEMSRWYVSDVAAPLFAALAVTAVLRLAVFAGSSSLVAPAASLLACWLVVGGVALMLDVDLRSTLARWSGGRFVRT